MRRDGYQPDHGTLDPTDPPGGRSAVQPVVRCLKVVWRGWHHNFDVTAPPTTVNGTLVVHVTDASMHALLGAPEDDLWAAKDSEAERLQRVLADISDWEANAAKWQRLLKAARDFRDQARQLDPGEEDLGKLLDALEEFDPPESSS